MFNFKLVTLIVLVVGLSGCSNTSNKKVSETFASLKNIRMSDIVGGQNGYFRDRGKDYHSSWLISPLKLPEEMQSHERSVKFVLPNSIPEEMPEVNLEPLDLANYRVKESGNNDKA